VYTPPRPPYRLTVRGQGGGRLRLAGGAGTTLKLKPTGGTKLEVDGY
jgi:hypothetical protein